MAVLFRLLLFLLLGYYLVKIFSFLFRSPGSGKRQEKGYRDPSRKEGEVRIDLMPENEKDKKNKKEKGDYIDFEEVE